MSIRQRIALGFLFLADVGVLFALGFTLVSDGWFPSPIFPSARSAPGVFASGADFFSQPPASDLPRRLEAVPSAAPGATRAWPPATTGGGTPASPPSTPDGDGPTPTRALPPSASISGVVGHRQKLALSCEARSAADWAAYFGVKIDELEFLRSLPTSDDPDRGFVGDVRGQWGYIPPAPYGVHASPVAALLRRYGLEARSQRGLAWDELRAEIAAGRPVIAWVVGHVENGPPVIYTASDGRRTMVARYEHTVIVIGYTEEQVTLVDGARVYTRSLERFLDSWGVLRNMAITASG